MDGGDDGFGVEEVVVCVQPEGTSNESGDCDHYDASIHPEASEICDGIDNN